MTTTVIFVQDRVFLGGVEILAVKVIEELSRLDFDVVVACRNGESIGIENKNVRFFLHDGYSDLISRSSEIISDDRSKIVFVSLHPIAAMASEIAGRRLRLCYGDIPTIHHFHWVNHSRAFFFSRYRIGRKLFREFFGLLPEKSTYFMNEAAKIAHQSFWDISLEPYPILRIVGREPLVQFRDEGSVDTVNEARRNPDLRIVSVGRLVPFKGYNVKAPEIVRRLLDSGINVTWDIWGYGPDESAILAQARCHDVTDRVRLLGTLPHEKFDQTVSSYDVFVGMGTAVLEAAKTGTPSCVAVENQGDACYGFLHQAPIDSVGDRVEGFPERRLHEVLGSFSQLEPQARTKIGKADALAVVHKESTIGEFISAILSAEQMKNCSFRERIVLVAVKVYLDAKHWMSTS